MNGSEKQITWATEVLAKWNNSLNAVEAFATSETGKSYMARIAGEIESVERQIADTLEAITKTRSFLASKSDAKFFIDNRDRSIVALAKADSEVFGITSSDMQAMERTLKNNPNFFNN